MPPRTVDPPPIPDDPSVQKSVKFKVTLGAATGIATNEFLVHIDASIRGVSALGGWIEFTRENKKLPDELLTAILIPNRSSVASPNAAATASIAFDTVIQFFSAKTTLRLSVYPKAAPRTGSSRASIVKPVTVTVRGFVAD